MSDIQNAPVDSGQGAPAPAPAGQAIQSDEPFYAYKGARGDEVYRSKDELDKFMREHALRQSDYTRKTQELSSYRKQHEEQVKQFQEQQKAFQQSRSKYDQWDQILKSRPDVYSQLDKLASSPPDASVAYDRSREYADEKYSELAKKLEAIESERAEERNRHELDDIFSRKQEQYGDEFDKGKVLELLDMLKDGQTEPLVDILHLAAKGKFSPAETERKIVEKLQKKSDAGLVPGRSAAPKGKAKYSSLEEAHQAATRDLVGG